MSNELVIKKGYAKTIDSFEIEQYLLTCIRHMESRFYAMFDFFSYPQHMDWFTSEFFEYVFSTKYGFSVINSPNIIRTNEQGSDRLHKHLVGRIHHAMNGDHYNAGVAKELTYKRKGVQGEYDNLGRVTTKIFHQIEVKSEGTNPLVAKGIWQGLKSHFVHKGDVTLKYALVTPKNVRFFSPEALDELHEMVMDAYPKLEFETCPLPLHHANY